MRPPWKIAIAPRTAGIEGLCEIQKPARGGCHVARQRAVRRACGGTDFGRARMADPVTGNIAPAHGRILENVAGDVGELHGDAEIDGMRTRCRGMAVEDVAHEQADRTRHPVGIAQQFRLVGKRHLLGLVLKETVDQRHEHIRREALFPHQRKECPECRIIAFAAGHKVGTNGGKPGRAIFDIAVRHVVEKPAKRVEGGGIASHALPEKAARPVEALAVGGK